MGCLGLYVYQKYFMETFWSLYHSTNQSTQQRYIHELNWACSYKKLKREQNFTCSGLSMASVAKFECCETCHKVEFSNQTLRFP